MKLTAVIVTALATLATASPVPEAGELDKRQAGPTLGLDVDFLTAANLPWSTLYTTYKFAMIEDTYGMSIGNSFHTAQRTGAKQYKIVTGGVHHPNPLVATASDQAKFFTINGGGWVNDGTTIPGALYLEQSIHNKTMPLCYNLTQNQWLLWIREFTSTYAQLNGGRYATIFTTYNWWKQCTYGYTGFNYLKVWVNDVGASTPTIPTGWTTWILWRIKKVVPDNYYLDYFNGSLADLYSWTV